MNRSAGQTVLLLLVAIMLTGLASAKETGFLDRTVKVGSEIYRYQVYVPANWDKRQKWPVILFLHGAGERGSDGLLQTDVGIGTAIRKKLERFPAIVVMPQCRKEVWWLQPQMEEQALAALEQSVKEFNGDRQRLYLTGLSMGGYGTWGIARNHPGKFAAFAPICAGVRIPDRLRPATNGAKLPDEGADPYAVTAQKVGQTPVWIFHGGDDKVVPVEESRKMNEALKAAGAKVKYTEYPGVGHNSWDKAYAEAEFIAWLLAQKLNGNQK